MIHDEIYSGMAHSIDYICPTSIILQNMSHVNQGVNSVIGPSFFLRLFVSAIFAVAEKYFQTELHHIKK